MSSNSNSEDVESREEECNGEHVVTTAGKLLKLTCSWKPIFFPFRKYVLWDKQPPMASQSKLLVSDDHKYALRMRLNWVTKRFELIVSQEPFPSLYKLKVIFKCEEDTWLEKTDFLPSSKAFFSWVPEYRKTFGYLNIHSSVKIICGIAKQQKIDLVFNGSAVNILLITPEKAIKLSANDYFRHLLTPSGGVLTLPRELLSGAGAGFCQVVVTTPMELLKIQLQDAGRTASEKGSATRIALNIVKSKGILGLYKGTGATIARDVNFSILYFPLFAHINSLGPRKMDNTGEAVFWHSLLSGNVAGAAAAFCVTPFDVVKTRLQLIHRATGDATYKGILDAFRRIAKEEGIFAFFKGAACRMAVMAPLFGVAQMVYYVGVAEWILGIDKSKC